MHIAALQIEPDVQTIVWDLDGTLLDSFGIYRDCLNQVLRAQGYVEVPEAILRRNHHGHIEESISDAISETGQKLADDEVAVIIREFYSLDNAFITEVDQHLFTDAVDLAERVHRAGKRQIVVTNRPHGIDRGNGSPRNLVQNSRLRSYVTAVLCGDDSEYRKPHREFLTARFGEQLIELGKMVVIGDQFVDAQLAANLGCSAILVNRTGEIAHLDRLGDYEQYVTIVPSLQTVAVSGSSLLY